MSSQFAIPSLSWSCKTYISGLHAYRLAMLVILVLELSIIHWLLWVKYNFIFVFFFVCFFFFATNIFLGIACTFSVVWLCTVNNQTTATQLLHHQLQCQLDQRTHLPLNRSASDGKAGRRPGNQAIFRA